MKFESICIPLKSKINNVGETEKTFISFKGKGQLPLIMIIKTFEKNNEVFWAECLFCTRIKIGNFRI